MIEVRLFYQDGTLTGIESKGHSGYAQRGSDIVCAAVSTLMQSLVLGLEEVAGVRDMICKIDERVPLIRATWPEHEQENISLLTTATAKSLIQIAKDNPVYVKVMEVRR